MSNTRTFNYQEITNIYNQMNQIIGDSSDPSTIAGLLYKIDEDYHEVVNGPAGEDELALRGDLGMQLLNNWENTAGSFPAFVENFSSWSTLVAQTAGDYSAFEEQVRGIRSNNPLGWNTGGIQNGYVASSSYTNSFTDEQLDEAAAAIQMYDLVGAYYVDTGMVSYAKKNAFWNGFGDVLSVVGIVASGCSLVKGLGVIGGAAKGASAGAGLIDDGVGLLDDGAKTGGRLLLESGDEIGNATGQVLLESGDEIGNAAGQALLESGDEIGNAAGQALLESGDETLKYGIQLGDASKYPNFNDALHAATESGGKDIDALARLVEGYGNGAGGSVMTAKNPWNQAQQMASHYAKVLKTGAATADDADLFLTAVYRCNGSISTDQFLDDIADIAARHSRSSIQAVVSNVDEVGATIGNSVSGDVAGEILEQGTKSTISSSVSQYSDEFVEVFDSNVIDTSKSVVDVLDVDGKTVGTFVNGKYSPVKTFINKAGDYAHNATGAIKNGLSTAGTWVKENGVTVLKETVKQNAVGLAANTGQNLVNNANIQRNAEMVASAREHFGNNGN